MNDRRHDENAFRSVMSHFASGVVILAGQGPSGPAGMTVQSFSALSEEPPMVMVAVARTSTSWPNVAYTGRFCVSILSSEQGQLARRFSRSSTDKFACATWSVGRMTGAPMMGGALAWIECEVAAVHRGGDHDIITAHVLDLMTGATAQPYPLVFYRSTFPSLKV